MNHFSRWLAASTAVEATRLSPYCLLAKPLRAPQEPDPNFSNFRRAFDLSNATASDYPVIRSLWKVNEYKRKEQPREKLRGLGVLSMSDERCSGYVCAIKRRVCRGVARAFPSAR